VKPQLSLEAFADWAEKQPAKQKYDYWDTETCACTQFANSAGIVRITDDIRDFWVNAQSIACELPRTFGALAARLRARGGQA
jgi:hypothetical protein